MKTITIDGIDYNLTPVKPEIKLNLNDLVYVDNGSDSHYTMVDYKKVFEIYKLQSECFNVDFVNLTSINSGLPFAIRQCAVKKAVDWQIIDWLKYEHNIKYNAGDNVYAINKDDFPHSRKVKEFFYLYRPKFINPKLFIRTINDLNEESIFNPDDLMSEAEFNDILNKSYSNRNVSIIITDKLLDETVTTSITTQALDDLYHVSGITGIVELYELNKKELDRQIITNKILARTKSF